MEEVFEHVPSDPYRTIEDAEKDTDDAETKWDDGECAEYVVRPADGQPGAGEIAGTTELHCEWDRRTGRLGLFLAKPFWGRGYSGERAAALLELAFERLDLEVVTTGHNDGNEKSRRAIEKYVDAHGGRYEGELRNRVPMGDGAANLHRYTISRAEYRAAQD